MLIVNSADLVETMEHHYFTSVVLWKLRLLQDASYCFILQGCPCSFLIFCALPHFLCLDIVEVTLTTGWLAPVVVTRMTTTFTEVSAACTLNLVVTQRDLAGLSHVVFAELFPYHSYFNRFSLSRVIVCINVGIHLRGLKLHTRYHLSSSSFPFYLLDTHSKPQTQKTLRI